MAIDNSGSTALVANSGDLVATADCTEGKVAPLLVFVSTPLAGHMVPMVHIAGDMIKRGFPVIFMTSEEFRPSVEKAGAEWYEQSPLVDKTLMPEREKHPVGYARLRYDLETWWIASLPARYQRLKSLLEMVRKREPSRQVIVVAESMSVAVLPFRLGAPPPKGYATFPKTIGINPMPLMLSSIDTAPMGTGLPPDATESGRARNKLLRQLIDSTFLGPAVEKLRACLAGLGSTVLPDDIFTSFICSYDTTFQLCSPSFEYPLSDLHPTIRFAGALPQRGVDPTFAFPAWWADVLANAALPAGHPDKKKLVVISQGTLATVYSDLLIPALVGLSGRPDVLVVAILGVRGATLMAPPWAALLPAGVPANARVADYLPYDAVLPYADVFVTNGSYGGVMHGITNGVPMVVAGVSEDKLEVSMRVEWSGFGVNLRTQTTTVEAVAAAIDTVLCNPAYKRRAERLRRENEDLDALNIIERQIRTYAEEPQKMWQA